MSTLAPLRCHVYRSERRAGTYVYLRERDGGASLPAALRESLGDLAFVLEFELSAQRRLAQESAAVVLTNLHGSGFHVQFPPAPPASA